MEVKRLAAMAVTAALGAGAAVGVAACGDDDRGTIEIEGGTTGTGTGGTEAGTTPTLDDPATVDEAPTTPTTPTTP